VRELRNSIEQVVLLAESGVIECGQFSLHSLGRRHDEQAGDEPVPFTLPRDGLNLEQLERDLVDQALKQSGGNVTKAAKLLGLSRDTLRYRIEKFRLNGVS